MYSPTLQVWLQPEPNGADYIDGPDLYDAFRNNPINRVDPTGLAAVAVKGNKYGDLSIDPQINTDLKLDAQGGVQAVGKAQIAITFKPTKDCNADQIAYLQIDRQTDFDVDPKGKVNMNASVRITAGGWEIDRLSDNKFQADYGWYGFDNNNPPQPMKGSVQVGAGTAANIVDAILYDKADAKQTSYQEDFITFAVNYKKREILAGITWGFKVDGKGVVTSLPNNYIDPNKTDVMNAIKKWNDQAGGLLFSKNSDKQQALGDFTVAAGT
jgi:hypothetical protein